MNCHGLFKKIYFSESRKEERTLITFIYEENRPYLHCAKRQTSHWCDTTRRSVTASNYKKLFDNRRSNIIIAYQTTEKNICVVLIFFVNGRCVDV